MSDIYITNLGSSWNGGASVNALTMGDPGWVFLAGGKQAGDDVAPLLRGYKDGVIQWDVDITKLGTSAEFRSIAYHDNTIFVVGGIEAGFDGEEIGLGGFVQTKPPWLEEPTMNNYSFYAQFDALTGDLKFAKVFESTYAGNESLSVIQVDGFGNSYISGMVANQPSTLKISKQGEVLWSRPGLFLLSAGEDGSVVAMFGSQQLHKLSVDGQDDLIINGWIRTAFAGVAGIVVDGPDRNTEFYYHGSLLDSDGELYLLYTQDDRSKDWRNSEPGALTTLVMKIDGTTGDIRWTTNLDPTGFNEASSIIFDPDGNLLISGFTDGDFGDQKSFGGRDAYLSTLNPQNGDILKTVLIGSEGDESASQAFLDGEKNLYLSGTFSSNYYSLENSGFSNVYLISDEGFTLMGDEGNNIMQGGDGNDTIIAGAGNDTIIASNGDDIYDGGTGFNTVVLAGTLESIGLEYASDGVGYVVSGDQGRDTLFNINKVQLSDSEYATTDLRGVAAVSARFSMTLDDVSTSTAPSFFLGNETLALHYQLIDTNPEIVISGSSLNDFIALQGGGNKAVNGISGNNVIDGGVDSTFVTGGSGNNTFFLDGRAPGDSWSTITDFKVGFDKATVWGWKKGVSKIAKIDESGGAPGFDGLTLHFENLLPSDASDADRSTYTNSITLTGKSLSDFGLSSSEELIAQINAGLAGGHFIIGQTPTDDFGSHGYLHIA